jgi:S-DNA-T family DNA segregation ATPase FtsK/SpoIIIE
MGNQTKKSPKKKTSKNTKKSAREQAAPSKYRGLAAVIVLLLSIFALISYFTTEGAFIGFFAGLVLGLVGPGYFALAPVLLLCAAILCFHRGRPIRLRVTSALMLIIMTGALAHIFMNTREYSLGDGMMAYLWRDGADLLGGGVISGALAELFHWLFHTVASTIVLICISTFFLLVAINKTVVGIADTIKSRASRRYNESDYDVDSEPATVKTDKHKIVPPRSRRQRRNLDIPLDNDTAISANLPKPGDITDDYFPSEPRVKTPDELVTENLASEDKSDSTEPETDELDATGDIPLDIPFMENQSKKAAPTKTRSKKDFEYNVPVPDEPPPQESEDSSKEVDFSSLYEGKKNVEYSFPPLSLLSAGATGKKDDGSLEIQSNSERLESAFRSFGVNVSVTNATRGPSVTRYEAELEAGVKLSKLTGLADDIALSLGTSGVRIAAMPNKAATVGIEVPNKKITAVHLREILESSAFQKATSRLTFAIGMDISGEAVVGNISKLPHMLVAGTTGSGKSVCLNSLIISILYRATPDDVRFIMIDPKRVEFKVYNDIPHLLVPVVTDVKKAAGALQWAVVEMMKRYTLFSDANAKDLKGYNQIAEESEELSVLPQIIVVIDELADLMLTAAKEVEESVIRVAQMGRAAGIHLIISTQSPRADVITGLMKANIPSRIALKVSSALESRIILDAGGNADKLVGNGDMLYAPIGTSKPMRLQGTWISEQEGAKVVNYIKGSAQSQYSEEVMSEIEKAAVEKSNGTKDKGVTEPENDYDEMLPQAVNVIFESGQASVSMLQRRLKLGYSRAARIVDQMEQMGIVGPFEGSKPRAMLITREQWYHMQQPGGGSGVPLHDDSSFNSEYLEDDN